jgi:Rab GDP dissociation inhibitor
MMVSSVHCISKKDYYVAIISTTVETNNPLEEIKGALDMCGKIKEQFVSITERYVPTGTHKDGLFISHSFDATSHFENETENVLKLYTDITGKQLDLENLPEDVEE